MKKYYQLLLFIFSAVSILCFVFYKHEYDRLRKVLEVLDFFGPSITDSAVQADVVGKPCLNGSVEFIPDVWLEYNEDVHIYSAFKVANEKGWNINSVAVVRQNSTSFLKGSSCALISGDLADDKFEGTIEWKKLDADHAATAYSLTCNVPEMIGNSHLFSVYDNSVTQRTLNVPLHLGPPILKDRATSLCILSKEPYWHTNDLTDFIQYYALLGVDNFFLYHHGIGDQVISSLNTLVNRIGNVKVQLATWNRPLNSSVPLDFALVNHDCFWRHGAKNGPMITVQFGQYLVLPKSLSLPEFLIKLSSRRTDSTFEVRIPMQSVCLNTTSSEQSPLRLAKLSSPIKKDTRSGLFRWTEAPNHPTNPEQVKIDPHLAKMLMFESCTSIGTGKNEDDPVLRRFSAIVKTISHL